LIFYAADKMKKAKVQSGTSGASANASAGGSGAAVDLKELERLLAFMAQHGLEELEYQRGAVHIRLRKPSQLVSVPGAQAVLHSIPASGAGARERGGGKTRGGETPAPAAPSEDLHTVKSPIVGTFYEAATPGAEPFVKIGDRVTSGQVLCIIEAMKLMNEIESDRAGEVVRRLVENGQPVEYGQALFALRVASGTSGD
jgi:acetyl-CoA carboxylase biotin carboxyl carrier protein